MLRLGDCLSSVWCCLLSACSFVLMTERCACTRAASCAYDACHEFDVSEVCDACDACDGHEVFRAEASGTVEAPSVRKGGPAQGEAGPQPRVTRPAAAACPVLQSAVAAAALQAGPGERSEEEPSMSDTKWHTSTDAQEAHLAANAARLGLPMHFRTASCNRVYFYLRSSAPASPQPGSRQPGQTTDGVTRRCA